LHAQNYAAHNILRRVPLLCHFADFAREQGATDLNSATSLVEKFASHWVARANCKNAVTRRNLCDDIQSAILQMLRLALEGRVTQNRLAKRFLLQSEAPGFFQYLREERGFLRGRNLALSSLLKPLCPLLKANWGDFSERTIPAAPIILCDRRRSGAGANDPP
jgi:hypothetical protein